MGKNSYDMVVKDKDGSLAKKDLWDLQRKARKLQEQNPDRTYIMYGIETVKANELFKNYPLPLNGFNGDIYIERKNCFEKYSHKRHGNLTEVKDYKVRIENS